MSCNRSTTILHGYFDNELDVLGAADFERHLEQCPNCVARNSRVDAIVAKRGAAL